MLTLKKDPLKDFIILNLTDPQLSDREWADPSNSNRQILIYTVTELAERIHPDLILISGDLAYGRHFAAYEALADFLDSFAIPWAPIWGNHDNQEGPEAVLQVVSSYLKHPYCLYEPGDSSLGNGNYVIRIEENGHPIEGILMMDSHDKSPFTTTSGETAMVWAKLLPEQITWYRKQITDLIAAGCSDTLLVTHIPIYAYRHAFAAAARSDIDYLKASDEAYASGEVWKKDYQDSFGVRREYISSYEAEDGMLEAIQSLGSTKHVLAGHDHVNSFSISYQGIRFTYGLKTGAGCYWNKELNGGTVLTVTSHGISNIRHEYINAGHLIHTHESN